MKKEKPTKLKKHATIFEKDGSLVPALSEKALICGRHLKLAHAINNSILDQVTKHKLLLMVDEVYDMGKRMDAKLMDYRRILGLPKGIGKQQEEERVDEREDWL